MGVKKKIFFFMDLNI